MKRIKKYTLKNSQNKHVYFWHFVQLNTTSTPQTKILSHNRQVILFSHFSNFTVTESSQQQQTSSFIPSSLN